MVDFLFPLGGVKSEAAWGSKLEESEVGSGVESRT